MATEVQCPIGDCGYESEPQSVHAHITASTDHEGESGVSWQREIADLLPNGEQAPWERGSKDLDREQWETVESANESNEESEPKTLAEQGNEGNEGSKESDESPDSEIASTPEVAGAAAATGAAAMMEGDGAEEGSGGIPIPVSAEVLVGVVLVALVGYYLYTNWNESGGADQEENDGDQEEETVPGGLI